MYVDVLLRGHRMAPVFLLSSIVLGMYLVVGIVPPVSDGWLFVLVPALCIQGRHQSGTKRRKSILVNLILVIVSFAAAVTVLDLAMRPFLLQRLAFRPHELYFQVWPREPSLMRYVADASYSGPIYGDLAAFSGRLEDRQVRVVSFRTDRFGFRNDSGGPDKIIDTIVLGDSFGVGNGTTQDRTWASLLTTEYGRNVYNLSMPGAPRDELVNLKIELPRISTTEKPFVIWAIFTGNDLDDSSCDVTAPRFAGLFERLKVRFSNFRRRSPVKRLFDVVILNRVYYLNPESVVPAMLPDGRNMLFFLPYVNRARRSAQEVISHPHFTVLASVFEEMKRFSESRNLRTVVVLFPTKSEVYSWVFGGNTQEEGRTEESGFAKAVAGLARKNGFPYLDLKPHLVRESKILLRRSGEYLWWLDDTHMNEHGNRIVAAAIHEAFLRRDTSSEK